MTERKDYEVGRGRPPTETRFKKGRSGNPSGRPKGRKRTEEILDEALHATVTIIEKGRRKRVTKIEYVFSRLVNEAAQGKPWAVGAILKLINTYPIQRERLARNVTLDMTPEQAAKIYQEKLRQIR